MRLKVLAVFLCIVAVAHSGDDRDRIVSQKDELEQIKADLDHGRAALDSLKNKELSVQNRIAEHDERIALNKVVVGRLNDQLRSVRASVALANDELAANKDHYDWTYRRFRGNLRQFYLSARRPVLPLEDRAHQELDLRRQIVYLAALSNFESGTVTEASALLTQSEIGLDELTSETEKVNALKKEKETAAALVRSRKEREQKELSKLYREKAEKVDQVLMLEQVAQEMENIIARLERRQGPKEITLPDGRVSVFARLKGQLPTPCPGKVTETYGAKIDPITKLRSFSPGIILTCRRGCDVLCVAPGEVAYVGELRGVGNFIIIDHGGNYFTTYAGLDGIEVTAGRMVAASGKLAKVGGDGHLRFELRSGREPMDPLDWIRIDGL